MKSLVNLLVHQSRFINLQRSGFSYVDVCMYACMYVYGTIVVFVELCMDGRCFLMISVVDVYVKNILYIVVLIDNVCMYICKDMCGMAKSSD